MTPLARLLKIDLNTLFCFHEDITQQEIGLFCKKLEEIVQAKGIDDGFAAVTQNIHEYPHTEQLLHVLTIQLDGLLTTSGLTVDEMRPYAEQIAAWYHQLAESTDLKISNSANFMLTSRYRNGEYEKAQETLNRMPDRSAIVSSMTAVKSFSLNTLIIVLSPQKGLCQAI